MSCSYLHCSDWLSIDVVALLIFSKCPKMHHAKTLTWSSTAGNPWERLALVGLCNSLQGCRVPSDPITMHRCPAPVRTSAWSCFSQKQLSYCFCFLFCVFGCEACGILVPWPRIEPVPPPLEGEVLTNGPPGKITESLILLFLLWLILTMEENWGLQMNSFSKFAWLW